MEKLTSDEQIKAHLAMTDEHFRELNQKHTDYDRRLHDLESKGHLSDDEQLEEVRLKKLKLRTKDQMLEIMSRYKAGHVM